MKRPLAPFATALLAAATVTAGQLTTGEAAAARKIYVGKCAKCHKFYEPRKYTEADWELWMGRMSRKSRLKSDQAALVKRYLDEYRAGTRARAR